MRKRCSVYVRNAQCGPACYYRVMQYLEELHMEDRIVINNALNKKEFYANLNCMNTYVKKLLQLNLYVRITVRRFFALCRDLFYEKPQTVIIQREVMPHYLPFLLKLLLCALACRSEIIWDFDDDIFESGEISKREVKLLLEASSHIIVVSEHVKSLIPQKFYAKVIVLPTTDKSFLNCDFGQMAQGRMREYAHGIRTVWVGTSGNLKYIDRVIADLDTAAGRIKKSTGKEMLLYIVCNHKYKSGRVLEHVRIKNIPWSRENAKKAILKSHIGIMPLEDTVFAKGKGGFKLIQYMASGLPVIADDVGFNRTAVGQDAGYLIGKGSAVSWEDAFFVLSCDQRQWEQFGKNAYRKYVNDFNFGDNLDMWKKLLK